MSETTKSRRRRWLFSIGALLLASAFAWPIAWKYRPINSLERQIVGHWKESGAEVNTYCFLADRRFEYVRESPVMVGNVVQNIREFSELADGGTWSASSETLYLEFPVDEEAPIHERVLEIVSRIFVRGLRSIPLKIVNSDHIVIGDRAFVRSAE